LTSIIYSYIFTYGQAALILFKLDTMRSGLFSVNVIRFLSTIYIMRRIAAKPLVGRIQALIEGECVIRINPQSDRV